MAPEQRVSTGDTDDLLGGGGGKLVAKRIAHVGVEEFPPAIVLIIWVLGGATASHHNRIETK